MLRGQLKFPVDNGIVDRHDKVLSPAATERRYGHDTPIGLVPMRLLVFVPMIRA